MESDTLETNKALAALFERDGGLSEENAPKALVKLCKKLERQRDEAIALAAQAEMRMTRAKRGRAEAWHTLAEIRKLFKNDASFGATVDALFAKPLEEAEAEIARLKSLENV